MTPERWQEIKRLFDAALACEPSRRSAFLTDACGGDLLLEQEVESLLVAHGQPNALSDVLGIRLLVAGSRLGPYEILSVLGAGGMGEVYKASDTRLDRIVAIKIVSPVVAHDPELRGRFEREARAAASLNHPHICTLHDVGMDSGVSFFVMEYLEGETLAARLSGGALDLDEALRYASQIAGALAAAHSHGITHRDLKPANVMLTDRGVKLLDFGLAKISSGHESRAPDDQPLTRLGRTPGTLHYMAPEQLEGEETDARTDIFALGAVLYEMITGRRAFDGIGPLTPPSIDRVVRRCLERRPEDRWQSCQEVVTALRGLPGAADADMRPSAWRARRLAAVAAAALLALAGAVYVVWPRGATPESVAVLPFINATANPELDYLSDGITDGLINSLSRVPRLRVTPRTLVARYANADERTDIESVARALGVQAIVTGRITQRQDTLTIAVALVNAQELSQLWGNQYRTTPADLLNVEKAMTLEIAGRLQGAHDPSELTRQYADNGEAYQAYLRGRYYMKTQSPEGFTRSIEYFQQAIAFDSTYALAYAGLADAYTTAGYWGIISSAEAYPQAKVAALRALEIDDRLAEAQAALAAVMMLYEWNFPEAEQRYKLAIGFDPASAPVRNGYAIYLGAHGRFDEAVDETLRAEQIDPVSPATVALAGWIYYFARQYDEAIDRAHRALELNAGFFLAHDLMLEATRAKGLGAPELRQALERHPVPPAIAQKMLDYLEAARGDGRARQSYLAGLTRTEQGSPASAVKMAMIYAGLGLRAEALDWLDKAYATREGPLVWLNVFPVFDTLRTEPRFVDLVRRVGLPR